MYEKQSFYKHWILPQLDINKDTVYHKRPVGNSTEMITLESNLNKDINEGAKTHCVYTAHLPDEDPRKFSLSTPAWTISTHTRLWDPHIGPDKGFPSSRKFMEDVNCVIDKVFLLICNVCGTLMRGFGTCCRHRKNVGLGPFPRGGKCEKKINGEKWKLSDVVSALAEVFSTEHNNEKMCVIFKKLNVNHFVNVGSR